jgi:hypothetical protein
LNASKLVAAAYYYSYFFLTDSSFLGAGFIDFTAAVFYLSLTLLDLICAFTPISFNLLMISSF